VPGDTRIRSRDGGEFDCCLAMPASDTPAPAVVLASAIHGVDEDLRAIVSAFAMHGYIAAAPDLFWRTLPGALARGDPRAAARAEPRLERIRAGERDLADVLAMLRTLPSFNGRAAAMGFCYGGPYAILGPKRLGYEAGIACHGTRMLDFLDEIRGVTQPLCIVWGSSDPMAPAFVLEAFRAVRDQQRNIELHVLPGVRHGFMMASHSGFFDAPAFAFTMERALASLGELRTAPQSR